MVRVMCVVKDGWDAWPTRSLCNRAGRPAPETCRAVLQEPESEGHRIVVLLSLHKPRSSHTT